MIENVGEMHVYRSRYSRPAWDSQTADYWPTQTPNATIPPPAAEEDHGEDAGWKAVFVLLGLCLLVSAVGAAVFGSPLP